MTQDREPSSETEWEVHQAQGLTGDTSSLSDFWDKRYDDVYGELLEGDAEYGRHGVLAEFASRHAPGGALLDVGCGTGILAQILNAGSLDYEGIDISRRAIEQASSHPQRQNARFRVARIEEYVPEGAFEVIVFNEVLYYLDASAALERISGWLRGPRVVLASFFECDATAEAWTLFAARVRLLNQVIVENPAENLRWRVAAGVYDQGG